MKLSASISALMIMIFVVLSCFSVSNLGAEEQPTVYYYQPHLGWWLKGYETRTWPSRYYELPVKSLLYAVHKQGMFREIFCDVFVNPYNETIFVRVTDVSEETKQEILNVMKPPPRVTVVFLEAKYPYYKLEEWVENIAKQFPKTEELGIPWTSISIENGTILITLEAVKPEYVKAIVNLLKGKVPLNVITIAKYPRPKLLALTDRIRPLEAGIQVQFHLYPYTTTFALNFLAVDKATGKEGAIIAGHAGGLYERVCQPTIDGENYIGSVSKNPPGPRLGPDTAIRHGFR
jgi:hypothetical protein